MRKQISFKIEVGDSNYVKPGEYFGVLSADGKTITSIQKRGDNGVLSEVTTDTSKIEANVDATADTATNFEVNPSPGKTAMKKATVSFPLSGNYAVEIDPENDTFPMEVTVPSGAEYLGFSKLTITLKS